MRPRGRSGLSLLELLVALTILAVVATLLVSSTVSGVRLLDRSARMDEVGAELALRVRLRGWLARAAPKTDIGLPTGLTGNSDELAFTTLALPDFAAGSAALRVSVRFEDGDLLLQVEELDHDGRTIDTHPGILARGVEDGAIAYLTGPPESARWVAEWSADSELPAAIRITAEGSDGAGWPEFGVALAYARY